GIGDGLAEDLKEKFQAKLALQKEPEPIAVEALRRVMLQTIDMFWVDHLEMMEYLRSSVNLRAYGQRDPLIEYKKDGLRFFREMEGSINRQVAEFVIALDLEALTQVREAPVEAEAKAIGHKEAALPQMNIGRNDPCPCLSGKKWKNCGLKDTQEHRENL